MARKLKTYQTSLGFFDQAIAAPSMKAALAAWGADSNLFHQGAAEENTDPEVVAATMAKPGCCPKAPGRVGRAIHRPIEVMFRIVYRSLVIQDMTALLRRCVRTCRTSIAISAIVG
jgi:hypothetical protein